MSRIQSIARFKIHPGKTEEFKRLSANCMKLARAKDPGTVGAVSLTLTCLH